MNLIKNLYLHNRFYYYIATVSILFLLSVWLPVLYTIAWIVVCVFSVLILFDVWVLFRPSRGITAQRLLPEKFSNSDQNQVPVHVRSAYPFEVQLSIIDELPVQFQKRDFRYQLRLNPYTSTTFEYGVTPLERGAYHFGSLLVFASTRLKIVARRYRFESDKMVAVYPSFIQMRKYEFLAMSNRLTEVGLKKIRRIGHTMEFEQIKNYVPGDDVRTINWKATAKRAALMVNQYQDEKSQPIYSIIDTGRVMKMPFEGLKLLDYAINASLAFSNIALLKNDRAGLLTFSKKVDQLIPASGKKTHLTTLNEALYRIDTQFTDANYSYLFATIKRKITQRSLLILYTNFEHISALKRQLAYLSAISKQHLLVVVFFENTELDSLLHTAAEDLQAVYHKTIAEKFAYEKRLIVKELESRGIHAILTKPAQLSVQVINKYLEFKSKGLI